MTDQMQRAIAVAVDGEATGLTARERLAVRQAFLRSIATHDQAVEAHAALLATARARMDAGDATGFVRLTDLANEAFAQSPVRRRNAERRARNAYRF